MILRTPHYYKDFKCISSECKDNCCEGGWEIDIDEDTVEFYNSLSGTTGDQLKAAMEQCEDSDEHCFILKDGKCPFLNGKGLCGLYEKVGEEHLGVVCTQFPRFSEYYGNIKETGIGLACEEAERIIFMDRNSWKLSETQLDENTVEDNEFDSELANVLWKLRDCFAGVIDGTGTVPDALVKLLYNAKLAQDAINDNEYEQVYNVMEQMDSSRACDVTHISRSPVQEMRLVLNAYEQLEVLGQGWSEALNDIFELLHGDDMTDEKYSQVFHKLDECIGDREHEYRNLLKYYLFRYFMEAAYDHDVLGKIQLMTTNYLVIREMDGVRYLTNGGNFSFQDRIDVVHVFSREVEYSEDNLEVLAEEFLFDEVFKPERLAGIVKSTF